MLPLSFTPRALLLLMLAAPLLSACDEATSPQQSDRFDRLSAHWEHPGPGRTTMPVAVGSQATLRINDPSTGPLPWLVPLDVTHASVDDETALEVVSFEDNAILLRAVGPGSTTLHVEGYGHGNPLQSEEFTLYSAEIDRTEFIPECGNEFAYLTHTTYRASLGVLDATGQRLHGTDLSPLTISGDNGQAELLDYAEIPPHDERMFPIFTTGESPGRYVFTPEPRGEVVELDVISSGDADAAFLNHDVTTRDGQTLLRITPQLLFAGQPICGNDAIEGTYQARSLTPERCEFIEEGLVSTEISAAYATPSSLILKGSGECTVEVEVYAAPGSEQAVVSRRSWDLDELRSASN